MSLIMKTKELEIKIFNALEKMGTYLCFEVKMPSCWNTEYTHDLQRVDLLSYDTKNIWRFYELKVSKSDFYSKAKHTFLGHLNYYVMPYSLYKEVEKDIPAHIGIYVANDMQSKAWCVKKAKKQELGLKHEDLLLAFVQALSRETGKHIKATHKINNTTTNIRGDLSWE